MSGEDTTSILQQITTWKTENTNQPYMQPAKHKILILIQLKKKDKKKIQVAILICPWMF